MSVYTSKIEAKILAYGFSVLVIVLVTLEAFWGQYNSLSNLTRVPNEVQRPQFLHEMLIIDVGWKFMAPQTVVCHMVDSTSLSPIITNANTLHLLGGKCLHKQTNTMSILIYILQKNTIWSNTSFITFYWLFPWCSTQCNSFLYLKSLYHFGP